MEDESFRDPRIKRLARKLGTSYFDALGRMAFVWHYCTDKQVYAVGDGTLADLTDREDFAELMISADLGEREGTLVRVKGTEGRIEWLGERRAAAAKGGEANRKRIAAKKGAKGEPNGSQVASQTVQKGSQTVQKGSPPSPSPSPSPNTSLPAVAGGAQGALPHVGAPPAKPPALTKAEVYSALERASRGRFAVGDGQPTDKIAIAINKHIGIMAERGVTLADVRLAGEYIAAWNYEVQL
ncbi:MAG TPA: hypothetical protein VEJ18_06330, partial [Planctomycetota bacterium]|nr:hypothetical protein [Planctomycetota bacterium]